MGPERKLESIGRLRHPDNTLIMDRAHAMDADARPTERRASFMRKPCMTCAIQRGSRSDSGPNFDGEPVARNPI